MHVLLLPCCMSSARRSTTLNALPAWLTTYKYKAITEDEVLLPFCRCMIAAGYCAGMHSSTFELAGCAGCRRKICSI